MRPLRANFAKLPELGEQRQPRAVHCRLICVLQSSLSWSNYSFRQVRVLASCQCGDCYYEHRKRLGLRPVQVLVSEQDIDYLLAKDYELTRTDDRSIGSAVSAFLSDSVLEAG